METMEKQRQIMEFSLKESKAPRVEVVKNQYHTAWGFVKEKIIREIYENPSS